MKAKNFELFMGCLGNGVTVCNKAVMEYGDYKTIAHISAAGNIKLYVNDDYIPKEDMLIIRQVANDNSQKYRIDFEKRNKEYQYITILDSLRMDKFLEVLKDKRPLEEKLPKLREYYYSIM